MNPNSRKNISQFQIVASYLVVKIFFGGGGGLVGGWLGAVVDVVGAAVVVVVAVEVVDVVVEVVLGGSVVVVEVVVVGGSTGGSKFKYPAPPAPKTCTGMAATWSSPVVLLPSAPFAPAPQVHTEPSSFSAMLW